MVSERYLFGMKARKNRILSSRRLMFRLIFLFIGNSWGLVKTLSAKTLLRDKTLIKERVPLHLVNCSKISNV